MHIGARSCPRLPQAGSSAGSHREETNRVPLKRRDDAGEQRLLGGSDTCALSFHLFGWWAGEKEKGKMPPGSQWGFLFLNISSGYFLTVAPDLV